jgi:hypothetical protein
MGASFPLEAFGEFLLRDFDRNCAIQPGVAGLIHLAHAACADSCPDLVRAKTSSSRERHKLLADSIPEGQMHKAHQRAWPNTRLLVLLGFVADDAKC